MPGVFISYRRDDSQGFAGRLADDLDEMLGHDRIFRDLEIPVGSDFTDVLQRAIAASDILLVVIGRRWAADSDQDYKSRLFEPTDWVRTEIEAAFTQAKQVIPILVGGASMPEPVSLPQSIVRLTRLQAASLTDRHWDADVAKLAEQLRILCPSLAKDRPPAAVAGASPGEVLREIYGRFIDEVAPARRLPTKPLSFFQTLIQQFGRKLSGLLTLAIVLGLIYAGIRLFGDDSLLRDLDSLEARLKMGWQRLQHYIERL